MPLDPREQKGVEAPIEAGHNNKKPTENNVPNIADAHMEVHATHEHHPTQHTPSLDGKVFIVDPEPPIVILYGPTSCGKSMTLVRLTRWLSENGYTITPDRSFRSSTDVKYQNNCDNFMSIINSDIAQDGTMDYMLVDVIEASTAKVKCKILEAPGEYYFDSVNIDREYPNYLETIYSAPNRKVWTFIVEPGWLDPNNRAAYVARINALTIKPNDRAVIMLNKADKAPGVIDNTGFCHEKAAMGYTNTYFRGIFNRFRNRTPIVNIFKPYNCGFAPFVTGRYPWVEVEDGQGNTEKVKQFIQGNDEYPAKLWEEIKKSI